MSARRQPQLTFWFEFASTYSYLSAARIEGLARRSGVTLTWQPFLLGPIFQAQGWNTSPFNLFPAKGRYMWRDMARQVEKLDLPPLTQPMPFPQNGLLAARVATLGTGQDWLPAFVRRVYHAQFAQGRAIGDETVVTDCLNHGGLDGAGLLEKAQSAEIKATLRRATQMAMDKGIFGAPSFETGQGELFWGNDRLEDALDWAHAEVGA